MKRKVIFIATILLLSACSSESKNGTYQSSVAANSATEAEGLEGQLEPRSSI